MIFLKWERALYENKHCCFLKIVRNLFQQSETFPFARCGFLAGSTEEVWFDPIAMFESDYEEDYQSFQDG